MSPSSESSFEPISEMRLNHHESETRLLLQRQRHPKIAKDKVQFGLPTVFMNEYKQPVTVKGPSIQLEQLPELIDMLTKAYEKYSKKGLDTQSNKQLTGTFADMVDDAQ